MRKFISTVVLLLCCAVSFAQTGGATLAVPRPFVEGGGQLNANGVQAFGAIVSVGLDEESSRFLFNAEGTYGFQRKTNDADQVAGEKGHTRTLKGAAFAKAGKWFFGAGAGWTQSSNTPYTKTAWYPRVGGGYDFALWRMQVTYLREENEQVRYPTMQTFTAGTGQPAKSSTCHCANGVQGVEVNVWYPNPSANKHVFMHVDAVPIWFHESITDPYNVPLTQSQKNTREYGSTYSVTIMYRF